ncbi:hypothetical protein KPSA1_01319 [Pseudomonas syringae pv. actinidiae]|uniref:Uncharacterized protein n=1 Tax=Pseudomonas syringae pv. actinidiae TaxID=103796 RepID=A0A2V0QC57_PSESF|nr:hypothetical protein KPSA1_01319 [Pseudomonas syringae pv. actinidiae]
MIGAAVSFCTVWAAAGWFATAKKSYRRATSDSALLVHISSISAEPAEA